MKIFLSIIVAFTINSVIHCGQVYGQSKAESIEWINSTGEKYLKEITGNSSIQWELDGFGSLRITDNNPDVIKSGKKLIKRYAFVNLFELDPNGVSIQKISKNSESSVFEIGCLQERSNCIKFRNHFDRTEFKAEESAVYHFELIEGYNSKKAQQIGVYLTHLINLIQK